MKILVVEDDQKIGSNLKRLLEKEAYIVTLVESVADGIDQVMSDEYDILICDRRLSDGDGIEIVAALRANNLSTPVIMLTAKSRSGDVIEGLDLGADDYLTKPFDVEVLKARIRALLRRRKKVVTAPLVVLGDVTVDMNSHVITLKNKIVSLSPKEYGVLEYLLMNRGKVVERMEILTHVWSEEVDLFSNTVDVHIRYLRKKLGSRLIKTVRGRGYML